mgnify:CR=1 FL=1
MKHLKKYITYINELRTDVNEVLDKISANENLNEYDKLILAAESNDKEGMKKLSLYDIYKANGGTFGQNILVKVKDTIITPHKFADEYKNRIGVLMPYINYDGDDTDNGYNMVSYKTTEEDIKKTRLKDYRDIANYKTVNVPQYIKNLEIVGLISDEEYQKMIKEPFPISTNNFFNGDDNDPNSGEDWKKVK